MQGTQRLRSQARTWREFLRPPLPAHVARLLRHVHHVNTLNAAMLTQRYAFAVASAERAGVLRTHDSTTQIALTSKEGIYAFANECVQAKPRGLARHLLELALLARDSANSAPKLLLPAELPKTLPTSVLAPDGYESPGHLLARCFASSYASTPGHQTDHSEVHGLGPQECWDLIVGLTADARVDEAVAASTRIDQPTLLQLARQAQRRTFPHDGQQRFRRFLAAGGGTATVAGAVRLGAARSEQAPPVPPLVRPSLRADDSHQDVALAGLLTVAGLAMLARLYLDFRRWVTGVSSPGARNAGPPAPT